MAHKTGTFLHKNPFTIPLCLLFFISPGLLFAQDLSAPKNTVNQKAASATAQHPQAKPRLSQPRYSVQSVHIHSDGQTSLALIRDLVSISKDQLLDESQVAMTRARLLATGYFVDVSISLKKGRRRGWVIVDIELKERPPLPAIDRIFLGFSETSPFFAGLGLVEPNLLGRGIILGGGFLYAPEQQALDVYSSSGRFFSGPLALRLRAFYLRGREPIAFGNDPRAGGHLDYVRGGGQGGFNLALAAQQVLSLDYHGEAIHAELKLRPGVRREPLIRPGDSWLSTLQLTYMFDSRDRAFIPSNGAQLVIASELSSAVIFSAYEYSRYHLHYEQFIPTWAMHSFSLCLDLGAVQAGQAQGNTAGAPFFSAYYLGDYSFFRRNRNSLPRQLGLNLSAFSTYDDLLASLTISYAYPIYLHGSFFYRVYVYASVNVSEGTTLRELRGLQAADDRFPVTFDAGFKFDTAAGAFVLSSSYLLDLVL